MQQKQAYSKTIADRTDCEFPRGTRMIISLRENADYCEYLMAAESSLFCEEAGGAETRYLRFLLCMVRDFALRFRLRAPAVVFGRTVGRPPALAFGS
jgi:hypothetical protein